MLSGAARGPEGRTGGGAGGEEEGEEGGGEKEEGKLRGAMLDLEEKWERRKKGR